MKKRDNPEYKMLEVSPHNDTFVAILRRTIETLGEEVSGETDTDQVFVWLSMLLPIMLILELGEDATQEDLDLVRDQCMEYTRGSIDGLIAGHVINTGQEGEEEVTPASLLNSFMANKRPI